MAKTSLIGHYADILLIAHQDNPKVLFNNNYNVNCLYRFRLYFVNYDVMPVQHVMGINEDLVD
jgi:hypothetical protein